MEEKKRKGTGGNREKGIKKEEEEDGAVKNGRYEGSGREKEDKD